MMEHTAAQGAALADELRNVVQRVEELIGALGEDRDEALLALRRQVGDAVASAKIRLAGIETQAQGATRQATAGADAYARDNPWTVVSIGAAVGLLLAAWVTPAAPRRDGSSRRRDLQ